MMHLTARSPLSIRPSCSMPCCRAAAVPTPARAGSSSSNKPQWQQQLASGVLAGSLLLAPVGAADAKPQQLADLLRSEYAFLDSSSNGGTVTREQLQQFVSRVSQEDNVPLVPAEQVDFVSKLFDLNQDGVLTSEEVLRSLVLDGAVSDDAVDEDTFSVFDQNRNGTVEADEWSATLGDLGANGDATKAFVFSRVDGLTSSGGRLGVGPFANALTIMRTVLLGY